jgi:hypothetical protein
MPRYRVSYSGCRDTREGDPRHEGFETEGDLRAFLRSVQHSRPPDMRVYERQGAPHFLLRVLPQDEIKHILGGKA